MIIAIIDRLLSAVLQAILIVWTVLLSLGRPSSKITGDPDKMIFMADGKPTFLPEGMDTSSEAYEHWKGWFKSQVTHPGIKHTYVVYAAPKAETPTYNIMPGITGIIIPSYEWEKWPRLSLIFSKIAYMREAIKIVIREKPSFIENFISGNRMLEAITISKLTKTPLVAQVQGDYDLASFSESDPYESLLKLFSRQTNKFILALYFRAASLVMAYNNNCAIFAICNGAHPSKVKRMRIHSFIEDFESFPAEDKSKLSGFEDNKKTIFLWSRFSPEKKIYYAIESLTQILDSNPDVRVLIAGDGPQKDEILRKFAKYEGRFTFLGFLSRPQLKSYITHTDICLIPIGGHALIEAALCEKPIVAFNWEWHAELLGDSQYGWLVDYPDVEAMTAAIRYILNNPEEAKRRGAGAATQARIMFSAARLQHREQSIWDTFRKMAA